MQSFPSTAVNWPRLNVSDGMAPLAYCLVVCLGWQTTLSAEEVETKKVDAQVATLHMISKALREDTTVISEEVAIAYRTTEWTGAKKTLALFSWAMLKIRGSQYDEAAEMVALIPEPALFSPPFLRLRLYLALHKKNPTESQVCLRSLLELVKNESGAKLDRLETSQFLGALSVILENTPEEIRFYPA